MIDDQITGRTARSCSATACRASLGVLDLPHECAGHPDHTQLRAAFAPTIGKVRCKAIVPVECERVSSQWRTSHSGDIVLGTMYMARIGGVTSCRSYPRTPTHSRRICSRQPERPARRVLPSSRVAWDRRRCADESCRKANVALVDGHTNPIGPRTQHQPFVVLRLVAELPGPHREI